MTNHPFPDNVGTEDYFSQDYHGANYYDDGAQAAKEGLPAVENPYAPHTNEWHEWYCGWIDVHVVQQKLG